MEHNLQDSLYTTLIRTTLDGYWEVDTNGYIASVNEVTCKMLGYSCDELTGMHVSAIEVIETKEEVNSRIARVMSGHPDRFETRHRRKDGTLINVEVSVQYLPNLGGMMCVFMRDITVQKRSQKDLLYAHDLMHYIIKNAQSALAVHDRDMKYLYVSDRYLVDYKVKVADVIGKHHYDVFPDLPQKWRDVHQRVLKGEILSAEEDDYPREDGTVDWTRWECRPWYESDGSVGGLIVYTEVITERKRTELALKENEEKYKTIFSTIPDAVALTKIDGTMVEVNEGFVRLSGFTRDNLIGKNTLAMGMWRIPGDREIVIETLRKKGTVENFETEFLLKGDIVMPGLFSASIVDIGNEPHILSVTKNITDRKMFEDEIIRTKDKAEEMSRLKSSLLLNMSHELRTPLNGILGFSGLLSETLTDPDQKNMADIILVSGNRLMSTLSSIMELAQVEADRTLMETGITDLSNLIREVIEKYTKLFEQKRLQFIETIDSDLFADIDPHLMNNVLFHLLDNAVKFTESGSVNVIAKKERREGHDWIAILVRDTGIGIPDGKKEMIFEAFRQGDEGIGRSHEGSGLGLTLCRKFTTLMGGEIHVESMVGVGSTFTILFPACEKPSGTSGPDDLEAWGISRMPGGEKPRVLIVDDNENNAELASIFLRDEFKTDIVTSGIQAVKQSYLNDYSLILMDINLGPEMDGLRTLQEIRKMEKYIHIPVIAVTGYSTPGEREYILNQGFNGFLSKPFSKRELFRTVKKTWNLS